MASRQPRLSRNIREYSEANGVTDGSIIAAIISAHTATNAPRPRPMVPGIAPIWRASSATPAHAPAADTSTNKADGISCRSPGTVQLVLPPSPDRCTPCCHLCRYAHRATPGARRLEKGGAAWKGDQLIMVSTRVRPASPS
jgi:hypothetical protein